MKALGLGLLFTIRSMTLLIIMLLGFSSFTSADLAEDIQAANVLVGRGCSGTIISIKHRLLLTAYHCIEEKISIDEREERLIDGTYRKVRREKKKDVSVGQVRYEQWRIVGKLELDAEIIAWDRKLDLALLQFRSMTLPFTHAAKLTDKDFEERALMPVVVIGNPLGQENTMTSGIISNVNRVIEMGSEKHRYIQLDAVIAPGSSGGAVYHAETGRYFSMIVAGIRGVPINFAIPWRVIREFLETHCWHQLWGMPISNRETCLEQKAKDVKVLLGMEQERKYE